MYLPESDGTLGFWVLTRVSSVVSTRTSVVSGDATLGFLVFLVLTVVSTMLTRVELERDILVRGFGIIIIRLIF